MKEELISVIIPVYKVEKYLPQCLESVIGQTYRNLEIILVDDASPDNSLEICLHYQKQDKRIRVIKKERNAGVSSARNTGIEACTGQYIYFLDSDDFIETDMLMNMHRAMAENNADLAICAMERVDVYGKGFQVLELPEIPCADSNMVYELLAKEKLTCMVQTKLYRRCLFEKVRFPIGKLYEDIFILGDVLRQCHRTAILSEPYLKYRIHAGAFTKQVYRFEHMDVVEAYIKLYQDMKEQKVPSLWFAKYAAYTRLIDAIKRSTFDERNQKRIQMLRRQILQRCGLHIKFTPMVFGYYWMRQAGYVFKEYQSGEKK